MILTQNGKVASNIGLAGLQGVGSSLHWDVPTLELRADPTTVESQADAPSN